MDIVLTIIYSGHFCIVPFGFDVRGTAVKKSDSFFLSPVTLKFILYISAIRVLAVFFVNLKTK